MKWRLTNMTNKNMHSNIKHCHQMSSHTFQHIVFGWFVNVDNAMQKVNFIFYVYVYKSILLRLNASQLYIAISIGSSLSIVNSTLSFFIQPIWAELYFSSSFIGFRVDLKWFYPIKMWIAKKMHDKNIRQ